MLKSYLVFPPGMQPTIAQIKVWNASMHRLKRVHWGKDRFRTEVLAAEIESESFQSCLEHDATFEGLLMEWMRQGVEVCERFDFLPDRDALQPLKKREQPGEPAKVRVLPDLSVRFWQPKSPRCPSDSGAAQGSLPKRTSHGRVGPSLANATQGTPGRGPWLLAGVFAAGTLAIGFYVTSALNRSGMERRQETIHRVDASTRENPRADVMLGTHFERSTVHSSKGTRQADKEPVR